MNQIKTRKQTEIALMDLYEKGYRYVVRDKEDNYLSCFSLKPKKYRDTESWGYVDPDERKTMMAYPIKNTDITEINWSNRSAMLISDFLGVNTRLTQIAKECF